MQHSIRATVGLLLAFGFCGCAEIHRGFEMVAQATSPQMSAQPVALATPDDGKTDPEPAVERANAIPSPKEIFDFHPAGVRPGTMRQAFIIDPNDGPLAGDVRRTAAELKTFLAVLHAPAKATELASCSASDQKRADAGCAKPPRPTGVIAARDPLALR